MEKCGLLYCIFSIVHNNVNCLPDNSAIFVASYIKYENKLSTLFVITKNIHANVKRQ